MQAPSTRCRQESVADRHKDLTRQAGRPNGARPDPRPTTGRLGQHATLPAGLAPVRTSPAPSKHVLRDRRPGPRSPDGTRRPQNYWRVDRRMTASFMFADRMGAALVAVLPTRSRPTAPTRSTRYRAGDVAYWADEQCLFVFRTDGESVPGAGLVLVGHVSGGTAALAHCTQNCALRVRASGLLEDGTDQWPRTARPSTVRYTRFRRLRAAPLWVAGMLAALRVFGLSSMDLRLPVLRNLARDLESTRSGAQLTMTDVPHRPRHWAGDRGTLSDRFGRRRPLIIGLLVYTTASLLCAGSTSIGALTAFRLLQGLAGASDW